MMQGIEAFQAREGTIRLGHLLKAAGLIESGGEAKSVLASGAVTVNGDVETRRGRQLVPGDVIVLGDACVRVEAGP
jgi:ribosome-associated protein